MSDPLDDYREAARQYELAYDELARLKASQRAYWVMVGVGAVLSILLSATVVIGLWKDQPGFTRWAGLVLVLMLTLSGVTLVVKNRPSVTKYDLQVRNLAYDKQTQAARLPLDSPAALRIYREGSLDSISHFRVRATRNRRLNNMIQGTIIVASALASTSMGMSGEFAYLRWVGTGLGAIVTVCAGLSAYFKFRERGHGLHTTADEIDRHYTAAQFRLDDFSNDATEEQRLERFARYTEKLKEEQRKRELQLEQSPEKADDRS